MSPMKSAINAGDICSGAINPNDALPDVQSSPDVRGIALPKAGISSFSLPVIIPTKRGGSLMSMAMCSFAVGVPEWQKGTHMSRLVILLDKWFRGRSLTLDFDELLREACEVLDSNSAELGISFQYLIEKGAPVTKMIAPLCYSCRVVTAFNTSDNSSRLQVNLEVPVATLCPCSREISQYGAHNQRAIIAADLELAVGSCRSQFNFEDVIRGLEQCGSCELFAVLKRADEKAVTERQYENPKFVEDVVRDAVLFMRELTGIVGFAVRVEAQESIHTHNAFAEYCDNFTRL